MTDMLQQAHERHEQIKKAIAQREADIESLKLEAEKLEHFVTLAKELFAQKSEAAAPRPAEAKPSAPRPAQADAPAQPQAAETQRVMPMRQSQSA